MVAKWKNSTLSVVMVILLGAAGLLGGCSIFNQDDTEDYQPPKIEVLKTLDVGNQWQVKQLRINIYGNDKFSLLYSLNENEQVEGYFQVEDDEEATIGFSIYGISQVLQSSPSGSGSRVGVNSDSFSFTASQAQGLTYVLTYDNTVAGGGSGKSCSIYTELKYPKGAPIYIPIESQE